MISPLVDPNVINDTLDRTVGFFRFYVRTMYNWISLIQGFFLTMRGKKQKACWSFLENLVVFKCGLEETIVAF